MCDLLNIVTIFFCNEISLKDLSPENYFLLKFYWGEPANIFLQFQFSNLILNPTHYKLSPNNSPLKPL